jgi:glucose dehydrogenase
MFTAEQYRAKAAEYASYVKNAQSPSETREFQNLERVYRSLAENAEWLASSFEQTMPAMVHDLNEGTALTQEEEQMLGCLGAAVMMRWGALPTKIQRELFESATSIGDLRQTAQTKGQIARFLHLHKKDGEKSAAAIHRRGS